MSAFTDEQINEIIGIFTQHMGTRQYIGARYVPLFGRKDETSIAWDNTKPYEPLTIVLYQGNSYTSRQYVPSGIDILNTEFWANTGNYNAQVEQYRTEVLSFDNRISANTANITAINEKIPSESFSSENTIKDYIDSEVETLNTSVSNIDSIIPTDEFSSVNTVKNYIDTELTSVNANITNINDIIPSTEFTSQNTVKDYIDNAITSVETGANTFAQANPYGMLIDDFAFVKKFTKPSGYNAQGIAVYNNNLYIAFTNNTNSIIREYVAFESQESETLTVSREVQIAINHCNSICVYNGMLYCSSWNERYIGIVNLSSFTLVETLNVGLSMRNMCIGNDILYLAMYNANMLACFEKDASADAAFTNTFGWIKPLNTQYSFSQDMAFYNNCIYRLCSAGTTGQLNGSYIEVYPSYSSYSAPLIMPIYEVEPEVEFEGISFSSSYCYITTQTGNIYRSQKMLSARPQVVGEAFWAGKKNGYIQQPTMKNGSGLHVEAITDYGWKVYLPPSIFDAIKNGARSLNLVLVHEILKVNGHYGGSSVMPLGDLSLVETQSLHGGIMGTLSGGVYFYDEQYYGSDDEKCIYVKKNSFTTITTGGVTNTTTYSDISTSGNYWYLVESVV